MKKEKKKIYMYIKKKRKKVSGSDVIQEAKNVYIVIIYR